MRLKFSFFMKARVELTTVNVRLTVAPANCFTGHQQSPQVVNKKHHSSRIGEEIWLHILLSLRTSKYNQQQAIPNPLMVCVALLQLIRYVLKLYFAKAPTLSQAPALPIIYVK